MHARACSLYYKVPAYIQCHVHARTSSLTQNIAIALSPVHAVLGELKIARDPCSYTS